MASLPNKSSIFIFLIWLKLNSPFIHFVTGGILRTRTLSKIHFSTIEFLMLLVILSIEIITVSAAVSFISFSSLSGPKIKTPSKLLPNFFESSSIKPTTLYFTAASLSKVLFVISPESLHHK